jgi:hypothetical protein
MSNVSIFGGENVPAFVKNRTELSAVAKALAGGAGASGGKRISIKGGVFRLYQGGKEVAAIDERYLDVVIVNAAPKISRIFYAKSYDGEASAPDCWSNDGVTPSDDAENKQHFKCEGCPQNIAGSGQNNSRACRYQQRIAVVLANDMEGDVLQLTLPAKSIFGDAVGDDRPLQAYAKTLMAQSPSVDPSEIVTRLKFDTKSQSPKLFFKGMRWLTEDEHAICEEKSKSPEAIKAVNMTVAKMDNVTMPAKLALEGRRVAAKPEAEADEAEPPAPAPKAKKAVKAEAAEAIEEPVVRKEEKKANAVPAKKSNLAEMVDDWDENE